MRITLSPKLVAVLEKIVPVTYTTTLAGGILAMLPRAFAYGYMALIPIVSWILFAGGQGLRNYEHELGDSDTWPPPIEATILIIWQLVTVLPLRMLWQMIYAYAAR